MIVLILLCLIPAFIFATAGFIVFLIEMLCLGLRTFGWFFELSLKWTEDEKP